MSDGVKSGKIVGIGDSVGMPLDTDEDNEIPGSDKVPDIGENVGVQEDPEGSTPPSEMGGGSTTSVRRGS